jgi:hypothetical protein
MMQAAGRHHRVRVAVRLGFVVLAVWAMLEVVSYVWASILLQTLGSLPDDRVASFAQDLQPHRRWARSQLKGIIEAPLNPRHHLRA